MEIFFLYKGILKKGCVPSLIWLNVITKPPIQKAINIAKGLGITIDDLMK